MEVDEMTLEVSLGMKLLDTLFYSELSLFSVCVVGIFCVDTLEAIFLITRL